MRGWRLRVSEKRRIRVSFFAVEEERRKVHALTFSAATYSGTSPIESPMRASMLIRDTVVPCAAQQFAMLEQLPGEIVDAVVTAVLQCVEGDALAGTRRPLMRTICISIP